MLENSDKIMHLHLNFDACPMHSPIEFVHLIHQNLSACIILPKLAHKNSYKLISIEISHVDKPGDTRFASPNLNCCSI